MAYISASRAERVLSNRRFTTDKLTTFQEAFTSVLDIHADEVYTDYRYIPTGSGQIPFSGSSQDLLIVSASVMDDTITPGSESDLPILQYWWRHKLYPGTDSGNPREVYYFRTAEPTSPSDTGGAADSQIASDQETNFISPKYIAASDASNTVESVTPGYKIRVYVSTNSNPAADLGSAVSEANFIFDYKTGVLSWAPGQDPADNEYVYMSVYQYVGRTLSSQIIDGTLGGGSVDLTDLYAWTESIDTSIGLINNFTSSIYQWTESIDNSITLINNFTESVDNSITLINSFTGSANTSITALNSFTGSANTSITALNSFTGSANTSIVALNSFTGSANTSITALNQFTGSIQGTANQITTDLTNNVLTIGLPDDVIIQNKLTILGDLVAENYIVSSSEIYMTTSYFSGDTQFGDTMDDIHGFTGSLYVTGSVYFGVDQTTTHQMTGSLYVSGGLYFDFIDGGTF